jgi:ligand-binding sensor domain-containing protein/signal transduction histidine kinase
LKLKTNLILLVLIYCSLTAISAFGQNGIFKNYQVVQYTDDNGLPQNSIKGIGADSDGFVWLATEDGLVRFDGRNFYTFNKSNLKISSNRFFVIVPSMDGKTASNENSGTYQSKIIYAVADGNEYVKIERGKASPDQVFPLGENSFMYVGDKKAPSYLSSKLPDEVIGQVNPSQWHIPIGYGNNNFYICDPENVQYYSNGKKQLKTKLKKNNGWNYFALSGKLHYLNRDGTLSVIDNGKENKFQLSGDILKDPSYRPAAGNVVIYWNNAADQVYFYVGKNIYMLEKAGINGVSTRLLIENFDLKSKNIQSIYLDKQNQALYLGSITEGLFAITNRHFEVLTTSGEKNVFYAQIVYDSNSVLTPTGVVLGKDPDKNIIFQKSLPALKKFNLFDDRSLLKDHNGFIWAKAGKNLFKFDEKGEKLMRTLKLNDDIKHLYQGNGNTIWLGMGRTGLMELDPRDPLSEPKLVAGKIKPTYFAYNKPDELIVGTTDGLYNLNAVSKKLRLIDDTEGLFIKSILVNKPNEIWFTASENGIMLFSSGVLIKFPMDNMRYLASPHCLVNDDRGFFWVTTNKGLFQISIRDLLEFAKHKKLNEAAPEDGLFYSYFAKDQGFKTNEFNGGCQPCAVQLPNGYISFPSLNGLVWLDPAQIKTSVPAGDIILDNVEVNNSSLALQSDTITFPQNPSQIKINFSSPFFGPVSNLKMYYALVSEGKKLEDKDWVMLKSVEYNITFSKLSAGNYTLYLRKNNGFGVNNFTIKKIALIIPPLWYQTWWAKLLFLILLALVISLYITSRIHSMKTKNMVLEKRILERTIDLEVSKSEVSRQLQMMSRLLTSITHDIQSPLNHIAITSRYIPSLIQKEKFNDVVEIAEKISDASTHTGLLLKDLLDYIKANLHKKNMKFSEINLNKLVQNKLSLFKSNIESKNIEVLNHIPKHETVISDYQMLAIVIHNLLDNATKFTTNGYINFSMSKNGTKSLLTISNNGIELSNDLVTIFNAEPGSPEEASGLGRKAGMGFLIVKEISVLINIGLSVTQTESTNFHLEFDNPQNNTPSRNSERV